MTPRIARNLLTIYTERCQVSPYELVLLYAMNEANSAMGIRAIETSARTTARLRASEARAS